MANRYLFLDLEDVTRIDRLTRKLHQAERHPANPVLRGESPWERSVSLYGTVLDDPETGRLRMWYLTGPSKEKSTEDMVMVRGRKCLGNITLLGYAESEDGIEWEKPVLGQLDFEGSKENNHVS